MSIAGLAIALTLAFVLLGVVLNHVYARLALVELTLNEGLPPGYEGISGEPGADAASSITRPALAALLAPGVHIFASRNCHACQRLLDELDAVELQLPAELHLRYVDRPRPLATSVAQAQGATLHADQQELATRVAADPLPYTIVIGEQSLVGRSVTPTVALVLETARNAGIHVSVRETA